MPERGRYSDNKVKKTNIKEHYSTRIYLKPPERDSDIYIITTEGDRLDRLAYNFYGDSTLWWFIANTNGLSSMTVNVGLRLRIPTNTN
tara:strand:- start:4924 stop:5187 length:264 start_codon:yes stop_codon:yes gene_type:complete